MAAVTLGKLKHWYCQVHTWRMLIGNVWVSRSYEYETRSAAGNYLVRPKGPIWVLLRRVVFSYNVDDIVESLLDGGWEAYPS